MSGSPRIRVAVIGAGVMGRHHAHNYLSLPAADLVAMVDPDPQARATAQRSFGCEVYPSTEALLASTRVDAASVVAPTSLHHGITAGLLAAGVHALVEKPVATSVAEATDLAERSRRAGLVLQVGHITRFYKAVRLLSERVRNPYLIDARRLTPHARVRDVGVILDLMIHDIDIVLGMVASEIQSVSVAGHTVHGGAHEDVASAQLLFEDGCVARFLASRVAPDAERSLVVADHERTYRVDFLREPQTEVAIYQARRGQDGDTHVRTDRHVVHEDNPLREELEHFLERIVYGAPPIGTLEDDLRSLRVATDLIGRLRPETVPESGSPARV